MRVSVLVIWYVHSINQTKHSEVQTVLIMQKSMSFYASKQVFPCFPKCCQIASTNAFVKLSTSGLSQGLAKLWGNSPLAFLQCVGWGSPSCMELVCMKVVQLEGRGTKKTIFETTTRILLHSIWSFWNFNTLSVNHANQRSLRII